MFFARLLLFRSFFVMTVNGMSISEDSFGDVSSLLDQVDLLTVQTVASYEVSHEYCLYDDYDM